MFDSWNEWNKLVNKYPIPSEYQEKKIRKLYKEGKDKWEIEEIINNKNTPTEYLVAIDYIEYIIELYEKEQRR